MIEIKPIPLGDLEFKAEDFGGFGPETSRASAERANQLLRERLEKAIEVFRAEHSWYEVPRGSEFMKDLCSKSARLVCIEEIK